MESFLKDFGAVDKAAWIEKVIKDLKGKPIEGLNTEITPGVSITPFHHQDDAQKHTPIARHRQQNDWLPGQSFLVENAQKTNQLALDGLIGGLAALRFVFTTLPTAKALETLLHDIDLTLISCHFEVRTPSDISSELLQVIAPQGSTIKGSWTGITNMELVRAHLPHFATTITDSQHTPIDDLAELLTKCNTALAADNSVASALLFELSIDENYFVSIAKVRAFRLLWANVLKAYGIDPLTHPTVSTRCVASTDAHDYKGMISATGMALSAAVGGADEIYLVTPQDLAADEINHHHRISRNVHHLLKMESFIDRVTDPSAGSYYIEHLTDELCNKAWAKFQQNN